MTQAFAADPLIVGSKRFTESYILGEILAQASGGTHKPGLGNTAILVEALRSRAIDVYPEYTGTIAREILKSDERLDLEALNVRLRPLGLQASIPLGFSNSYALGMRRAQAEQLKLRTLSDLAGAPRLRLGLSHEFLGRRDGWPGLKAAYRLPQEAPRGLDHGLAYEALAAGEVDVIDLYTTDAKIERFDIAVLEDDKHFFPPYDAVLLHRVGTELKPLQRLEGKIDAATMRKLNARAEIDKVPFAGVAAEFLGGAAGRRPAGLLEAVFAPDFGRLLTEHLALVFGSLAAAIAGGIPLGLLAARSRLLAQPILVVAGLVQTMPSLALLAFLIPLTGTIGAWPALIALFLYALLPITRNTHAGLVQVPGGLVQAGIALGLTSRQVLIQIKLPLALPTIMAGIKTSAVINVGTATIAAFIGAGGFGERISQGLALNDHAMLLAGALPAAALALAVHGLFEWLERSLVPPR
ncbi:MAG: glycine betaine ABC transporter substrate-binding protein [Clostridia bacterium]